MRYAYKDLGDQQAGTTVTVYLKGSAANVILLDSQNFAWYRAGHPFMHTGGLQVRSPAQLEIPQDGHWYVVVDHGGYKGRFRGNIEVDLEPPREPEGRTGEQSVVAR